MRKRKYIMLVSLIFNAAIILAFAAHLIFQNRPSKFRSHRRSPYMEAMEKLPEEVKQELREIWKDFPRTIMPAQSRLDSNRVALSEILLQPRPDSAAINTRLDSIGALQTQVEKIIVRQMLREKAVLPQEYQEQFMKMMMWRFVKNRRPGRHSRTESSPDTTRQKTEN